MNGMTLAAALVAQICAAAAWGPAGCEPVGSAEFLPISGPVWKHTGPGQNQANLWHRGAWRGAWFHAEKAYHPWEGDRFGPATQCPVDPPADPLESTRPAAAENFGVDPSKIGPERKAWIGRKEVSWPRVLQELGKHVGDGPPDDTALPHLTIIAKDSATWKTLLDAVQGGGLAEQAAKHRVQVYDWSRLVDRLMLEPFGLDTDKQFQAAGTAAFLQSPAAAGKGHVMASMRDFDGIGDVLGWLRKRDPNWDPNKPPAPGPGGPSAGNAGGPVAAGLGGLALLLLLSKGRTRND